MPPGWFARGEILRAFYADFRPLFRQIGSWCTGIRCETRSPVSDEIGVGAKLQQGTAITTGRLQPIRSFKFALPARAAADLDYLGKKAFVFVAEHKQSILRSGHAHISKASFRGFVTAVAGQHLHRNEEHHLEL